MRVLSSVHKPIPFGLRLSVPKNPVHVYTHTNASPTSQDPDVLIHSQFSPSPLQAVMMGTPPSSQLHSFDSQICSHKFPFARFIIFLALLLLTAPPVLSTLDRIPVTPANFLTYYTDRCDEFVPAAPVTGTRFDFEPDQYRIFYNDVAYFTGGRQIVAKSSDGESPAMSVSLRPRRSSLYATESPNVIKLEAMLKLKFPFRPNATQRRNLRFRVVPPKFPVKDNYLKFILYGFWSKSDGKLCTVGYGTTVGTLGVVFKVNYPVGYSNVSTLINGVLDSLAERGSLGYFDPISILAVPALGEYKYTLIDQEDAKICDGENDDGNGGDSGNLSMQLLDPSMCLTQLYKYARNFDLEYGNDCSNGSGGKCYPFGSDNGVLPKFMTIQGIRCGEGGVIRVLIGFSNSGYYGARSFAYEGVFDPNTMFIGEGSWDQKTNRFCVVACRVLNFKDSFANASVGDCSVRLSLRFRRTLEITHMSYVVGKIWSNKTVDDAGYFKRIGFHGNGNQIRGLRGLKYEYTMLNRVSKSCATSKSINGRGKAYPNGYASDMEFSMSVRNDRGQVADGYSSPLFVGNQLYEPYQMNNHVSGSPLNVSYRLSFTPVSVFNFGGKLFSNETVKISAEGTYDKETGVLCLIGCRHLILHVEYATNNYTLDCDISINLQVSPLNGKVRGNIKGTIRSMRARSDPLFFGQLEISSKSMYISQTAESIWRMDVEITLVLISNTLACVFVALQLYHAKKHPDVLPFISIVMLAILVLGHMIPLLLNFEALFMINRNRQNVFLESGGWLEVNEVIVRLVTLIAFLLHFRLLQLAWSSRINDGSNKSICLSEKKVTLLCLPLYIGGALIAWYVRQWKDSYRRRPYFQTRRMRNQQHGPMRGLKSYAGFILDGFLFPQIIFNLFLNTRERALSSGFYIGITIIRLLPHAYDLYRAHSSTWYLDSSYIYANHRQDFYSTSWDIIIPLGGLLFAGVIYLQQRFGGRCIFSKRFRHNDYEKVPVDNGEELRERHSPMI